MKNTRSLHPLFLLVAIGAICNFAGDATASTVAQIEALTSGSAVTLDSNPVVTFVATQPGTGDGWTYPNYIFLAQDSTGSLLIRSSGSYVPAVGDSISITNGQFNQYNTFLSNVIPTIETSLSNPPVLVSSGNAVPVPTSVTVPQLQSMTASSYDLLGHMLTLNNVTLDPFPGQIFPVQANGADGSFHIFDSVRNFDPGYYFPSMYSAINPLAGTAIPTGRVTLTGTAQIYAGVGGPYPPPIKEFVPFSITPVLFKWTGGAGAINRYWSTTSNWDSAPAQGDSIVFSGSGPPTINDCLSSVNSITFDSTAAFVLRGNGLTITNGITNNSTSNQRIEFNLTLSTPQQFNAAVGNLIVTGSIASAPVVLAPPVPPFVSQHYAIGAVIKTGSRTLTLTGDNTYSGGTTISGGTLLLGHVNALGSKSAGVTVNAGTLDLRGFSPTVGALNGSGGAVQSNVVGAAQFTIGNGGGTGLYSGTVANGSGTVGLIKTGAGTQTLMGNNTYSGGTTVTNGTLQLGHSGALGASTGGLTVNAGTVDLHGYSPSIAGLDGSGGAIQSNVEGAVSLTVGNNNAYGYYSGYYGTIANGSGAVALIKTGNGIQALYGNNTYSGGTTVAGGTLQMGHVNALGAKTAAVTVNSGTLDLHGFSPTVGALNGTGGAVQGNAFVAVALTVGNGGASGSYAGSIQDGYWGAVSVTKTGAGTQTLSGYNRYSGGTTVNGGTLVVGDVNALGTGGLMVNGTAASQLQAGLTAPIQLPSLTVAGGATPTATFDITNNDVIVQNGDLATLTAQVTSGMYNGGSGLWSGPGITSSTAAYDAANGAGDKAVGMIINDDGFGNGIYDNWPSGADSGGAVSITNTDVLVKYTLFGDANLDGNVDAGIDYALWATGNSDPSFTGWLFGDFNYDGTVDASIDYALWATGNASPDQGLGGGVQPVPEPSTLVLAALGALGMLALRRCSWPARND